MRIAIICSDNRMIQVCDNLSKSFFVLEVHNVNDLEMCKKEIDVFILPVKGPDKEGKLQDIHPTEEFWKALKEDILIFCGMRNEFLEQLPYRKIYYMEDAGVIHDNAILTAEGVLNELIGCSARSIYDMSIDVVGYGNCGKVIYDILRNLHVKVRVIRRKKDVEDDANIIEISEWKECGDVIIHTSIQPLDKEVILKWKNRPILIDIATPDAIEPKCAEELGICVLKAGNLPGRFACITAGNIIADFIREELKNER